MRNYNKRPYKRIDKKRNSCILYNSPQVRSLHDTGYTDYCRSMRVSENVSNAVLEMGFLYWSSSASWFVLGEVDIQMLTLLQSTLPAIPITADIVEGSSQLTENFKGIEHLNHFGFSVSKCLDSYFYPTLCQSSSSYFLWMSCVLTRTVAITALTQTQQPSKVLSFDFPFFSTCVWSSHWLNCPQSFAGQL